MFRFCAFYPQLWSEGKGRGLLNIFRRTIVLKSAYLSALTNVKNISYTTRIKWLKEVEPRTFVLKGRMSMSITSNMVLLVQRKDIISLIWIKISQLHFFVIMDVMCMRRFKLHCLVSFVRVLLLITILVTGFFQRPFTSRIFFEAQIKFSSFFFAGHPY